MSDLDNEELIATRKLHRLDDGLFEEDEKIKVGEYVRTDKGEIAKVTSVAKEALKEILGANEYRNVEFCNTEPYVYGNIVKHSKQLIDLIENKDILKVKINKEIIFMGIDENTSDIRYEELIKNIKNRDYELLEILTHQQFEANCYKVGGE